MVERPSDARNWNRCESGVPLLQWFKQGIATGTDPQATQLRMKPQKSHDCSIEVQFAWLASVLPRADYKLAKAHVLNVLAETATSDGLSEYVVERLKDRTTSALSGHVMS